jgi:redox-sensing transcriptional repressor
VNLLRTDALEGALTRRREQIPSATVARLPLYLRALSELADRGVATCSSEHVATAAGVSSANVRKDLSHLGSYGTRGVGYDVQQLRDRIAEAIGQTQNWDVIIVGSGHLGSALAAYQGFGNRGIHIAAVVDEDPKLIGTSLGGVQVQPVADMPRIIAERGILIGIIATPPEAAQNVADALVSAGVTSILNFAPTLVQVPDGVDVRQVDVAVELQILAYHEQRKATATVGGDGS